MTNLSRNGHNVHSTGSYVEHTVSVYAVCFFILLPCITGLQQQARNFKKHSLSSSSILESNINTTRVSVTIRQATIRSETTRKNETLKDPETFEVRPTVRCPNFNRQDLPLPPNIPPPCESDERYYASPLFCLTTKTPLLLILVLSYVGNFDHRQALRQEWVRSTFHMQPDFIAARPWAYTFVVGLPKANDKRTAEVMNTIDLERCQYKDVLTVDVLEDYYNLTWKKMEALQYLVKSDLDFEVVLKTDDDAYVNIQLILEWLPDALSRAYKKSNSSVRLFYAGVCPLDGWPIREIRSKWYLPPKEYAPEYFPPFCFGAAYFLSQDLVKAMLKLHDLKKAFKLEDVHSGLLINDTGLVPADHVVNLDRIYKYDIGHCGGRSHQYPIVVARSDKFRHDYYNEFMRSLCK